MFTIQSGRLLNASTPNVGSRKSGGDVKNVANDIIRRRRTPPGSHIV